jgi:hypothetical protein
MPGRSVRPCGGSGLGSDREGRDRAPRHGDRNSARRMIRIPSPLSGRFRRLKARVSHDDR